MLKYFTHSSYLISIDTYQSAAKRSHNFNSNTTTEVGEKYTIFLGVWCWFCDRLSTCYTARYFCIYYVDIADQYSAKIYISQ